MRVVTTICDLKLAGILFMTVVVSNKIGKLLDVYMPCNVE